MKEKIIESLENLPVPGKSQNLGDLRWVTDIAYCDGTTKISMLRGDISAEQKAALDQAIRQQVLSLPGMKEVNLVTLAQPSGPVALPTHGAPSAAQQPKAQAKNVNEKQPIPGVTNIIAVASGKGGVGKSTVAVNLAAAFAYKGKKVGICDTDIYGPSMPLMLGLHERPTAGANQKIIPLERNGIKVMSIGFLLEKDTAVIWRGPMVMQMVRQFLRDVDWGELDYLVLDLPPGTGDAQLTIVQTIPLSGVVIVTTPNDIALLDARRGLSMFREVSVPVLGIVENMSLFECPHCHEKTPIFDQGGGQRTAKELGVPFLGNIPIDTKIRRGGDTGQPVVLAEPESSQSKAFLDLADIVMEKTSGASPEKKKGIISSILSRL